MAIMRGTFTFTFLFDTNVDELDWVKELTIEEILGNCDDGHFVGGLVGEMVTVEVPDVDVPAAEIALGADGTFFADPDELAHAQMDADLDAAAEDEEEEHERDGSRSCDPTCSRRFSPAAECDCSKSKG